MANIKGRAWYDIDKNNRWNAPPDVPIANTKIVIMRPSKRNNRAAAYLVGIATTGSHGQFQVEVEKQTAGKELLIFKETNRNNPIGTFIVDETGGGSKFIPVPRPEKPSVKHRTVSKNTAIVGGTVFPGAGTIVLYANGSEVGRDTANPDGSYTVSSAHLNSGAYVLKVAQQSLTGAESELVPIGIMRILDPPTVISITTDKNTAQIIGTGSPGAIIKVYANNQRVGGTVAKTDGSWTVPTIALEIGTNQLTVTQEDGAGVSDKKQAGIVTVTSEPSEPPTWTQTTRFSSGAQISGLIEGTGQIGAIISIYADAIFIGSTLVASSGPNAGKWHFTTDPLPVGITRFTAVQTTVTGSSRAIGAGFIDIEDSLTTTQSSAATNTRTKVPMQTTATVNCTEFTAEITKKLTSTTILLSTSVNSLPLVTSCRGSMSPPLTKPTTAAIGSTHSANDATTATRTSSSQSLGVALPLTSQPGMMTTSRSATNSRTLSETLSTNTASTSSETTSTTIAVTTSETVSTTTATETASSTLTETTSTPAVARTCNVAQVQKQVCDLLARGKGSLVNGDFDTTCASYPGVTNANAILQCVPGWNTTAPDGNFEIWSHGFQDKTADTRPYFAELNAWYASTLYQDVDVVPGEVIHWSIKHRGRDGNDTMEVTIGPPDRATSQGRYTDGIGEWGYHDGYYYVAPGQFTARFAFTAVDSASGERSRGNLLDSITLQPALTACNSTITGWLNTPVLFDPSDTASLIGNVTVAASLVPPINGNLTRIGDNFQFTPYTGFLGTQFLEYALMDEVGCNSTALITIEIMARCNTPQVQSQICGALSQGRGTLVNGNFETTCAGYPGTSNTYAMSTCLPGWNTTEPSGYFEIWADGFQSVPADTKPYFIELSAYNLAKLYQDISVVPGEVLHWSMKHRGRWGIDTLRVSIGTPGSEASQGAFSDGTTAWGFYNGSYLVPAGMYVARMLFEFVNTTGGNQNVGNFLDSLTLRPALTACQSSVTTTLNTPVLFKPLFSASGTANISMTVSLLSPVNGAVVLNQNNSVLFTPTTGFLGTQLVQYTMADEFGCNSTSQVNITVS